MTDLENSLEALVDKHGMGNIVHALAVICAEKADHVRSNWQDEDLADTWEKGAKVLARANAKLPPLP